VLAVWTHTHTHTHIEGEKERGGRWGLGTVTLLTGTPLLSWEFGQIISPSQMCTHTHSHTHTGQTHTHVHIFCFAFTFAQTHTHMHTCAHMASVQQQEQNLMAFTFTRTSLIIELNYKLFIAVQGTWFVQYIDCGSLWKVCAGLFMSNRVISTLPKLKTDYM